MHDGLDRGMLLPMKKQAYPSMVHGVSRKRDLDWEELVQGYLKGSGWVSDLPVFEYSRR